MARRHQKTSSPAVAIGRLHAASAGPRRRDRLASTTTRGSLPRSARLLLVQETGQLDPTMPDPGDHPPEKTRRRLHPSAAPAPILKYLILAYDADGEPTRNCLFRNCIGTSFGSRDGVAEERILRSVNKTRAYHDMVRRVRPRSRSVSIGRRHYCAEAPSSAHAGCRGSCLCRPIGIDHAR